MWTDRRTKNVAGAYHLGISHVLSVLSLLFGFTVAVPVNAQETSISQIKLDTQTKQRMVLSPGIIWTVYFDRSYKNAAIGDASVLDAFPLTDASLYMQTKEVGLTNVTLFGENDEYIGEIEVQVAIDKVEPKLQSLINDAVPDSQVSVSVINNRIYLKGTVGRPDDIAVVLDIAQTYAQTQEPLVYSISYPEHINPRTTINVIRNGASTAYTTAIGGVENTGKVLIQYGTIQAKTDETVSDGAEPAQQPVVINISNDGATVD
ncbi:pilus assembly protein N-terminal domain-containing protein [Marivita geojedonensis]|uniref:Pilus formation protein N-terminal domain-containing protein n=1 Tax=Marivita geojedonensis TaxID=1123756 RepID=A0A1X4NCJ5_9RHOB|nr:pilus assembly protein N-terminal domain-containing protein [Marivita geojedonensis]OSQ44320.1 hypothetical protein MGEO_19070 [Marivita geojedonensis]PRY72917.1 putative type II/III system pilus formation protein [Marivita geojedonensis]